MLESRLRAWHCSIEERDLGIRQAIAVCSGSGCSREQLTGGIELRVDFNPDSELPVL